MIDVKFKKLHEKAASPRIMDNGSAGADLTATEKYHEYTPSGEIIMCYNTGLALEIPEGYMGLIFPRSSICNKDLSLSNSVGLIDSSYRGEIVFKFRITTPEDIYIDYDVGDRIGQLVIMPYPKVNFIESIALSKSERDTKGFGSTGA